MRDHHRIVQRGTVKLGQKLGGERLDHYVHRFGFGSRTGLDFPGESPGIVRPLEDWSGSSIGNIPIGQGIAVTPIQMVSAYSTIANRGKWVEPRLLTRWTASPTTARYGSGSRTGNPPGAAQARSPRP